MAEESMARLALKPAPVALGSSGSVAEPIPMAEATTVPVAEPIRMAEATTVPLTEAAATITGAMVEEAVSSDSSHESVQSACHAAQIFMGFVDVILGVVAVGDWWRHEGAARGEVVGVHFARDRVLK
jgi:hypothetical protein